MLGFPFITFTSFVARKLICLILGRDSLAFFTNPVFTVSDIIGANWAFPMSSVDNELLSFDSFMPKRDFFNFRKRWLFPHRSYTILLLIWHVPSRVIGKSFWFWFWASLPPRL